LSDQSVAPPARTSTRLDQVADRIEQEIDWIRSKRPALSDRLDRAAGIIVQHLACRRQRVIRVRVGADGRVTFLVNGKGGVVYSVSPTDWSCSCPDYEYRGKGCKHSLAAYILRRAVMPARRLRTCDGCDSRFPRREMVEVHENEHYFPGDLLCRSCADRAGVEW